MLKRRQGAWCRCVMACFAIMATSVSAADAQEIAAKVNEHAIPAAMLDLLANSRERGPFAGVVQQRAQLLEDLINTEVLYQAAKQAGIDQQEAVSLELELAHKTLLSQFYVMHYMDSLAIKEADLRALYDQTPDRIMVQMARWDFSDQTSAESFLNAARSGNAQVTDGEIEPWQTADNYSFAAQLDTLKQGDWLPQVSNNGQNWQVWRMMDRSKIAKPPFEQSREGLRQELAQQQLQGHIATLKEQASISRVTEE